MLVSEEKAKIRADISKQISRRKYLDAGKLWDLIDRYADLVALESSNNALGALLDCEEE